MIITMTIWWQNQGDDDDDADNDNDHHRGVTIWWQNHGDDDRGDKSKVQERRLQYWQRRPVLTGANEKVM